MIRSELAARIADRNPHLYGYQAENVVDAILNRIEAALVADDRVELRGFGVFSVVEAAPRLGRNPRTGEAVEVGMKAKVHFRATKAMRVVPA